MYLRSDNISGIRTTVSLVSDTSHSYSVYHCFSRKKTRLSTEWDVGDTHTSPGHVLYGPFGTRSLCLRHGGIGYRPLKTALSPSFSRIGSLSKLMATAVTATWWGGWDRQADHVTLSDERSNESRTSMRSNTTRKTSYLNEFVLRHGDREVDVTQTARDHGAQLEVQTLKPNDDTHTHSWLVTAGRDAATFIMLGTMYINIKHNSTGTRRLFVVRQDIIRLLQISKLKIYNIMIISI